MDPRRLAEEMQWRATPAHMAAHLTASDIDRTENLTVDEDWDETVASTAFLLYPHIRLLGRRFADAGLGVSRRQLWSLPPRYGKSLTASQWGPAWFLEMYPHKRVILASYGHDLALHNARSCRNILRAYSTRLSTQLSKDASAADQWNTLEGGGLKAAGVGGALTGFGADLLIIDDPFKDWEEAQSANQRDKVWNWYRSVARTRLHKGGSIIVLNTRWSKDDLTGRLLEEDRNRVRQGKPAMWDALRLPTIADGEARGEPDALGREDGEVLCSALFPDVEVMEQREELGDLIFGAMHQQDPTDPEGAILLREWWQRFDGRPQPETLYGYTMSCDLAFKGAATSDFVVLQVWARNGVDHFLLDQVRGRYSYTETKAEIRRLHARWPQITRVLVEDTANGPAVISEMGGTVPGMIGVTPRGSKESRVHSITPMIRTGHVHIPSETLCPWSVAFVSECAEFPNGTHDDSVDALSQYLINTGGGPLAGGSSLYPYSATTR